MEFGGIVGNFVGLTGSLVIPQCDAWFLSLDKASNWNFDFFGALKWNVFDFSFDLSFCKILGVGDV